jgi:hypothetical protein
VQRVVSEDTEMFKTAGMPGQHTHTSKTGFETTFLRLHKIDIIAAKHARHTAKDKIEETEIRRELIRKI